MLRTPSDFAALSAAPGVTTALLGVRHRTVAAPGNAAPLRLGIATSRKVGNAVVRNRIRRRLKSIVRELAPQVRPGAEILIGVRAAASTATFAELRVALVDCLRRAKLVEAAA